MHTHDERLHARETCLGELTFMSAPARGGAPPPPAPPAKPPAAKPSPKNPPDRDSSDDDDGDDKNPPRLGRMVFHALMLFPTSGRVGFKRVTWPEPGPVPIEREALKTLLLCERDLRLSAECQQRFAAAGEDPRALSQVTEWVQREALAQCGMEVNERSLLIMRSALSLYPDVRLVLELRFFGNSSQTFTRTRSCAAFHSMSGSIVQRTVISWWYVSLACVCLFERIM